MVASINIRLVRKKLLLYFIKLKQEQRRRQTLLEDDLQIISLLLLEVEQKKKKNAVVILTAILKLLMRKRGPIKRSIRRHSRNIGWWENVWATYNDKRFKDVFRVSRETFLDILSYNRPCLERQTVTEEPISPELRLAVCLYRLGRGDYLYTVSELVGLGASTVCTIVTDVCVAIIQEL